MLSIIVKSSVNEHKCFHVGTCTRYYLKQTITDKKGFFRKILHQLFDEIEVKLSEYSCDYQVTVLNFAIHHLNDSFEF
jgi:hypothetical protein